jgi:hypothetical protein
MGLWNVLVLCEHPPSRRKVGTPPSLAHNTFALRGNFLVPARLSSRAGVLTAESRADAYVSRFFLRCCVNM